jgi:hypothetical protein
MHMQSVSDPRPRTAATYDDDDTGRRKFTNKIMTTPAPRIGFTHHGRKDVHSNSRTILVLPSMCGCCR